MVDAGGFLLPIIDADAFVDSDSGHFSEDSESSSSSDAQCWDGHSTPILDMQQGTSSDIGTEVVSDTSALQWDSPGSPWSAGESHSASHSESEVGQPEWESSADAYMCWEEESDWETSSCGSLSPDSESGTGDSEVGQQWAASANDRNRRPFAWEQLGANIQPLHLANAGDAVMNGSLHDSFDDSSSYASDYTLSDTDEGSTSPISYLRDGSLMMDHVPVGPPPEGQLILDAPLMRPESTYTTAALFGGDVLRPTALLPKRAHIAIGVAVLGAACGLPAIDTEPSIYDDVKPAIHGAGYENATGTPPEGLKIATDVKLEEECPEICPFCMCNRTSPTHTFTHSHIHPHTHTPRTQPHTHIPSHPHIPPPSRRRRDTDH